MSNNRLAELLRWQFSGEIVRRHLRIRCNGMRLQPLELRKVIGKISRSGAR